MVGRLHVLLQQFGGDDVLFDNEIKQTVTGELTQPQTSTDLL